MKINFVLWLGALCIVQSPAPAGAQNSLYPRAFMGPASVTHLSDLQQHEALHGSIHNSQSSRRLLAWKIAMQVFEEVSPIDSAISQPVPLWLSWIQPGEYSRILYPLWESLSLSDQQSLQPFDGSRIQDSLITDWQSLFQLPDWDVQRYRQWKDVIGNDSEQIMGVLGLGRNYFNPELLKSYLDRYSSVTRCVETLLSRTQSTIPPCFDHSLRKNSVAIKAVWRLESLGIPYYETTASTLKEIFESAEMKWTPAGIIHGAASGALRVRRGNRTYALVGLHIMSKIQDDWFWQTLWWSPNAREDFGEDRPAEWDQKFPHWNNYKLCSNSDFTEQGALDVDPGHRTLKDSLAQVSKQVPNFQWCSNPYIEAGPRNATSNCISCHQFAGRDLHLRSENILSLPDLGRLRRLPNSPADYLWSLTHAPTEIGLQTYDRVMGARRPLPRLFLKPPIPIESK